MEKNFRMIAQTMFGLEEVLATELRKLGASKVEIGTEMLLLKEIRDLCIKQIFAVELLLKF